MKNALLLSIFLLGGLTAMAQSQFQDHLQHNPHLSKQAADNQKLINNILSAQPATASVANKPTTIQQRVIAQTFINQFHSVEDSVQYKYSGTNGSKFNFNDPQLNYDVRFYSSYLPSEVVALPNLNSYLLADSIFDYFGGSDTVGRISNAFYNSGNKVDSFCDDDLGSPNDVLKTVHTFNAQHFLTQVTTLSNTNAPNIFDTSIVKKYCYDIAGTQLLSDTLYRSFNNALRIFNATHYHYNAQSLVDSIYGYTLRDSGYELSQISAIKYNANSQLQNINVFYFNENQALTNLEIDTVGYAASVPFYTYYAVTYVDLIANNVEGASIIKTVGNNNLPDSVTYVSFDNSGTDVIALKYTYNGFNNPIKLVGTNMSDSSFSSQYNFYYETFDDAVTAIINIKNNKDFSIYPNPFNNKLNIDWKGAKANQTKIALVNVLEQMVYSSNQNLITGTNTIDIPNLIKGNYVLLIQDVKGNTWKSQLVKN